MRFLKCFRLFICYIILAGLIFSCMVFQAERVSAASPPLMEVGITLRDSSLRLSFGSGYRLLAQNSGVVETIPAGEYTFLISGSGIEIRDCSGASRGIFNSSLYLQSLSSPADSFFEILNACYGKEYRGELKIDVNGRQISPVNHIDLETYLRGVVGREMSSSWGNYGGMEALKAQAVAARTYALYRHSSQRHSGCHICDTEHCQAYRGRGVESLNTDLAIKETRGEILTYNGKAIEPVYHATNGGFTEEAQHVWFNPLPYFRSDPDPYDNPDNPLGISNMVVHSYAIWEADIPCEKIAGLLVSEGYTNPGVIEGITVASSFPSGRVNELVFQETGGRIFSLLKEKIRTVLGSDKIKSTLFTVREEPESRVWIASSTNGIEKKESFSELEGKWADGKAGFKKMLLGESFAVLGSVGYSTVPYEAFIFDGRGWGHGVGMSQNGAYNRSRAGQSYREILAFYYPGAVINSGY